MYDLDIHAVGLELGTECGAPLLKEGFAARVGRQKGSWENTAERGHCEDETALALNHSWSDHLCDAKSSHAVDGDNVFHFLLRSLDEWNGNIVAEADIVDENGDIQLRNEVLESSKIRVLVERKVHGQTLGLDRVVLGLDFGAELVEL